MGSRHSTLSASDLRRLQTNAHFSGPELARLYERFKALDRDGSGTLSAEELLAVPEFAMNPLSSCLLELLLLGCGDGNDTGIDSNREINFVEFVGFLSKFHADASVEEKAELAARLMNGGERGLRPVLEAMVGQHLSEDEVNGIMERTMEAADSDRDGNISSSDLMRSLSSDNINALLTIKY